MTTEHVNADSKFKELSKRFSAAWRAGGTGPLLICRDVVDVIDSWDRHKAEAGDVTASAWLRDVFGTTGRHEAYWRKLVQALDRLGEAARRTIHYQVAFWLHGKCDDVALEKAKFALVRACRENGGTPLSKPQAQLVVAKTLGWAKKQRAQKCARCEELAEVLKRHGIAVPERCSPSESDHGRANDRSRSNAAPLE